MKFAYKAFDKAGKPREATVEGPSQAEATELLRRDGFFVAEIRAIGEPSSDGHRSTGAVRGHRKRLKNGRLKTIAGFMRHLSVLVTTGTPIVDAIQALEDQSRDPAWKAILAEVRSKVEAGAPLSEALACHPRYFDSVCRSLVRAGESGGKLDVMLTRLAELTRKQHRIRQGLVGAMVYPCLLISVSITVLCTMLLFVMPRFTGLFKTLDVPLPPTTKALMALSAFLINYWWAMLAVILASVFGFVSWIKTEAGRSAMHRYVLHIPQLGRVMRSFATARFARLMGLLLDSRVPMLECLELTRQATVNIHYVALLRSAQDALTRGEPLSSAIATGGLIDPSVCQAVKNGERTGQLGPVLSSMADFLDEENEVLIKALTSLVEPLILITLGIVVGLVAMSMFLPLFDLTAMAGSSGGGGGGS